jgi:hypothetical protein
MQRLTGGKATNMYNSSWLELATPLAGGLKSHALQIVIDIFNLDRFKKKKKFELVYRKQCV